MSDWTPLFRDQGLDGFYTWLVDTRYEDPRSVFTLQDGVLRISGEGLGYLATCRSYHNYDLRVSYKWGTKNWAWGDRIGKARDSGVFLHGTGPDGNSVDGKGAFMAAIECNVFQGAVGDFLLIRGKDEMDRPLEPRVTVNVAEAKDVDGWYTYLPGGQPVTVEHWGRINWIRKSEAWEDRVDFWAEQDVERPGAWNDLECRCRGDGIEVFLNGEKVNEALDVFPNGGKILLQCEGSEIFYRDLRIRRVD